MSGRTLAALSVGLAIVAVSAQGPPSAPPAGTGLIVGQVIDVVTGRGVADVAVTPIAAKDVRPGGSFANGRAILSDSDGRFVLRGFTAGTYQLAARRAGYVEGLYGATVAGGEGKSITLTDGGRFGDATIRLWKLAAIGGTVLDDAGDPIIGLQVRAFKRNLVAGRWKFGEYYSNIKYGARTDDRGMYRLSDLEPGEYVVTLPITSAVAPASAVAELDALRADPASRAAYQAALESFATGSFNIGPPQGGAGSSRIVGVGDFVQTLVAPGLAPMAAANGPWLVYQTQFYPGATLSTSAQPIAVKAGDERSGIDFNVKPVRTWRVSGTVSGLPEGKPMALRLVQTDGDIMVNDTEVAATLSSVDGAFTFVGVPPGRYAIKIVRIPQLPQVTTQVGSVTRTEQAQGVSMDPTLWASVPVSVGGSDVTGVTVPLSTGTRANGRVVFVGSAPKPTPAQLASLEITVDLAGGRRPVIFNSDRIRLAGETFATPELVPDKYLIRANSVAGWTMKSAMAGDREVVDTPLVVDGREIPAITITFTDRPLASLSGVVRSSGTPATDALVCLFPAEREAWVDYGNSPRRLRRVRLNQSGAYSISGLPKGDYFAVAVADDRTPDWRDPKHLDALSRIATRVTIVDEEAKTVDLPVQRAPATPAQTNLVAAVAPGVPEVETAAPTRLSGPFVDISEPNQQTPVRDAPRPTPQPTGTASISGVVVSDGVTASPIRRVVVTLNSADPRVGRTAVTDDTGRFAFSGLPAARYSVVATKPGYLDAPYGAPKPGRPGTPLVLAADDKPSVTLRMIKGSVITGTIRDARGEPVRGIAVNLSQYELVNGERRLTSAGRASQPSDDRGQYRIYDLAAGEYFVNVERGIVGNYRSLRQTTAEDLAAAQRELQATGSGTVTPAAAAQLPEMGYAPVFYPGTTFFSQAAVVTVGPGEEKAGIDIPLQLVALARLSAHVVGPDGQPPAMVQARLVAQIQLPGLSLIGLDAGTIMPVRDGNVVIGSIPPGEYTLHVGGSTIAPPPMAASSGGFSASPNAPIGLPMWATVPLNVEGRDINGLNIQLQLGKIVSGRVVFDGAGAPPASIPIGLNGPQVGGTTLFRRGTATPAFSIDGVVPGGYRLSASGVRGWTLKSALVNGQDAADLPVDISSDISDVVVTLTDKLTELSGVLQTPAGTPASNYFVIVFAKDPAYWSSGSRRIASLRPATDGRFMTSAAAPLPPGDYCIAAVTDVTSGQWFDPAFLRTLVPAAITITIAEGEKKRQDLAIK